MHLKTDPDGLFGRPGTIGTFEASLKDIPDPLAYLGLVVLKMPEDEPKTEEPVIYGFVRFQSARSIKCT
jgi:hypothetical protein